MTPAPPSRDAHAAADGAHGSPSARAGNAASRTRRRFMPPTFDSFRHAPFRWYTGAMLSWNAAMNMQMLVRGYLVYELTGSFAALGTVSLAGALPMLVLSIYGGVLADRVSRKAVMQAGQFANFCAAALMAVLILSGQLRVEYLFASSALQGTVMALMMPSQQAMLPEVVGLERMMNSVPLNAAAMNLMQIFAPAAGGFLIAAIGAGMVYVTMAMLYGLAIVTLVRVPTVPIVGGRGPTGGVSATPRGSGAGGLAEGVRYLGRDRTILVLLLFSFFGSVLAMPLRTLLPGYVAAVFGSDAIGLGQMQAAMGAGAMCGALALASVTVRRKRGLQLAAFAIGLGAALLAFSTADGFLLAAGMLFVVGLGTSGRQALGQVLLHEYVENEYRGRVMAIYMMQFAVMSLGTFLVGLLAEAVGPQVAIGSLGLAMAGVSVAFLVVVPRLRRLD